MRKLGSLLTAYGVEALLEHSHAMIVLLGPAGEVADYNAAFEAHKSILPDPPNLYDLISEEEHELIREWVSRAHRVERPARQMINLRGPAGPVCFDCLIIPLPDSQLMFVAEPLAAAEGDETVQKLSRQVRLFRVESAHAKKIAINKQVELEAIIAQANEIQYLDPLTRLPNRRWLMNALQTAVMRSEEFHNPLSVSMLDIDHFKTINDTHGHIAGDEVLQQIGEHLQIQIRRYLHDDVRDVDTAGRYGGEEFLILLPNTPIQSAMRQASRICDTIRKVGFTAGEKTLSLTVSVGIAELRIGAEGWQELLDRADKALYQAKERGRDRWIAIENH